MGVSSLRPHAQGNAIGDMGNAPPWAGRRRPYLRTRRLLAELLGTFALTLVAAGGPVIDAASGVSVGLPALVVAPGLVVMAMIYTLGPLSGAHFNPAVTLAFTLRTNFPWQRLPGYWLAQLAGSFLGDLKMPGVLPLAGSAVVLLTAAVTASAIPAARAARTDVIQALRME